MWPPNKKVQHKLGLDQVSNYLACCFNLLNSYPHRLYAHEDGQSKESKRRLATLKNKIKNNKFIANCYFKRVSLKPLILRPTHVTSIKEHHTLYYTTYPIFVLKMPL